MNTIPFSRDSAMEEYFPAELESLPPPPVPVARTLAELVRPEPDSESELIRHRWLCRAFALLLCGPTGIGKSSLALMLAICWAMGRACFGLVPTRPLKSLIIQAENDDGDLADMREGVIAGLDLSDAEALAACEQVFVCRDSARTGLCFLRETVYPLLAAHRPDVLWLDPALSFLGGEMNSQKDVGGFLRNGLNPLLLEFDCAAAIVHHSNKPALGKQKPDWSGGDYAYLGAGSAEWANFCRSVLALRAIGSHHTFELHAAKRGGRLGWQDAEGQRSFVKYLAHAKEAGSIYWREVQPDEIETGMGRPKGYDPTELLELLPDEGLPAGEWLKLAASELGISRPTFHRARKALLQAKRVLKGKQSGKYQPIKTP